MDPQVITLRPIGRVRSPVSEPVDEGWGSVEARIVVEPALRPGLRGLAAFSHVVVLTWLHEASFDPERHLVRRPRGLAELPELGIFAQRARHRPNPIGTSCVALLAVEEDGIRVRGLDAIDGTPVLDLKPYFAAFDAAAPARAPAWVERLMQGYFRAPAASGAQAAADGPPIKLYYAPRTRAVRIRWLLEELGVPYRLERVTFSPPERTFSQRTPFGKLPVIEDEGRAIFESGAILEYLLEHYGDGGLAPAVGSPRRGEFLQWVHFSEATAYPPLGTIVWHTLYKKDAAAQPAVLEDARERAASVLRFVENALSERPFLLGDAFSAADIMLGFTLAVASVLGVLGDEYPRSKAYLARLQQRPAFERAVAD